MVLTCSLLALPRSSRPQTLPLPRIDRAEADRLGASGARTVEPNRTHGLAVRSARGGRGHPPFRAFAERWRRYRARHRRPARAHEGRPGQGTELALAQLTRRTDRILPASLGPVRARRKANSELEELGGDFLLHARHNRWFDRGGRFLADDPTRRVLFRLHWADLIGKRNTFRFRPRSTIGASTTAFCCCIPSRRTLPADDENTGNAVRVRVVNALSRKDPDYPAFFARGLSVRPPGRRGRRCHGVPRTSRAARVRSVRALGQKLSDPHVARRQLRVRLPALHVGFGSLSRRHRLLASLARGFERSSPSTKRRASACRSAD